jgi:hypothetical protein
VIGLIAVALGLSLGAIAAGSKTQTTTVSSPPLAAVQTISGHLPVLTKTVHAAARIVIVTGPTRTQTKTVRGPTRTVTVPAPLPKSPITDGTWQVGIEVGPGTYRAPGGSGCRWEIESGSINGTKNRIRSKGEFGQTNPVVTLSDGDRFTTENCGTWH